MKTQMCLWRIFIILQVFCLFTDFTNYIHVRSSLPVVLLEILQNLQQNTCIGISFLIIKKGNTTQVFSCEFCEILKKTLFIEHLGWLLLSREKKKIFFSL